MSAWEKARIFMARHARPLDMARFQYHFEGGSKENVMNVLRCYQNADGGFGHAIEADCWNPNSIPLHASGVCAILKEIDWEDAAHPVVQGLIRWMTSGAHFDGAHWAVVVESNNDYPHAPWWTFGSESSCHTDYNGTAQMAGLLVRYAERESEGFHLGLRIAREAIAALGDELSDMHTCACYIHLKECIEIAGLTHLIPYEELKSKLHKAVNRLICRDVSRWGEYVCRPLAFMNSKESEYAPENMEIALQQCDYILKTQSPDGSWELTWRWEDYPDAWAVSRLWWKGQVIIENLLYLKGFGRL